MVHFVEKLRILSAGQVHCPPRLCFDPLKLLNFALHVDPDPAFHFYADPDPQPCFKILSGDHFLQQAGSQITDIESLLYKLGVLLDSDPKCGFGLRIRTLVG